MYQLIFRGECTPGTDPDAARANARNLFKASPEQLERMFSGRPVVIRNRLEEPQAEKYQAVLEKHGMVAYIEPMEGGVVARPEPAPVASPSPESAAPAARQEATGSPSVRPPAREPGDRPDLAGDKVDQILAGSSLTLDPPGTQITRPREVEPPMFQHLDEWTLAPPGSVLGEKRDVPPPVVPDVSHLSLEGGDAPDGQ